MPEDQWETLWVEHPHKQMAHEPGWEPFGVWNGRVFLRRRLVEAVESGAIEEVVPTAPLP